MGTFRLFRKKRGLWFRVGVLMTCGLLGALVMGGIGWLKSPPAPPSVRFVEFREEPTGRVAVFRVRNESRSPFCYPAKGPALPDSYFVTKADQDFLVHGLGRGRTCSFGIS